MRTFGIATDPAALHAVTMNRRSVGPAPLWAITLIVTAAATACESNDLDKARRLYTATDTMGAAAQPRTIPVRARAELIENSGATMSITQPGVIFTINDSGNEPILFAIDTTGADRGAWRVLGATNRDWEAIASGPCGATPASDPATTPQRCLYIADVGDNEAERRQVTLYRVREPRTDTTQGIGSIRAESLSFTYEDRRHDVEAMFVAPDGSVNLITKRPLRTLVRRLRPALVFSVPAIAWGGGAATARRVDSLPAIRPGSAPNRVITDASLSLDGKLLAVRTYWQVYIFATDSATGRVRSSIPPSICNVAMLGERQGEGISWLGGTTQLLLTSEGRSEPLRVIECPLPRRN